MRDGPEVDHAAAAARCGGFRAEHGSHSDWRHDEANQRVTPGCDASGPAVLRETTGPEEPSYAETPVGLGVPALGGAHRCGCHDDQTADRGESRCLWLPQVPWSGLGFPAATLCTDPAIGRFFPLPYGRSGRKRIPRGLWPIVEGGDRSPREMI